jgi:hypothetical protein
VAPGSAVHVGKLTIPDPVQIDALWMDTIDVVDAMFTRAPNRSHGPRSHAVGGRRGE